MPSPAFVQKKSSVGTNPVPLAVDFTSNNTAGNLLIACAEFFGADAPYSISDTRGNTWTPIFTSSGIHSSGGWDLVAWYAMNCAAGANTVTFDSSTHNSSS